MELSKTRILHISKYYYPFLGGTEQVARDVVKALFDTGAEQRVICCLSAPSKTMQTV